MGGAYQYEADIAYGDVTNRTDAVDYSAYSLDFFAEMPSAAGTFTLSGAYLNIDLDDLDEGADPDSAPPRTMLPLPHSTAQTAREKAIM
ncbi:MAG: hypothetical protein LRY50_14875 [Geovibrio sp.]|nr:hypothetical protein [Geovibrio sp.]